MDLITLSDLPDLGDAAKPKVTIAIGRLDDNLRDPRYGKFAITQRQVDGWKRNLTDTFGGQVSVDFDHSSDRGSGTRAAAWITDIGQQGKLITADVEFTKRGARAVRDGDYRYTSPTFVENYTDEHGHKHGPALIGAALTNRPVLRKGMPTLSLSHDEFEGVELATLPTRDSRAQMDKTELRTLLDLPADADDVTILAAVANLPTGADAAPAKEPAVEDKPAEKTPMALDTEGRVLLSQDQVAQLMADANAGAAAARQLQEQTFTHAWEKALSEGRAAPSQEETVKALFDENPELAVKTLDSFVKIVPTTPAGSGEAPNSGQAPMGMDPDRFQLHTEAKQLADQKRAAKPGLAEDEAYLLAVNEISERQFQLENPGI